MLKAPDPRTEARPLIHVDQPVCGSEKSIHVNSRGLANLRKALATAAETGDDVTIPVFENGQWTHLNIVHGCHTQFECDEECELVGSH